MHEPVEIAVRRKLQLPINKKYAGPTEWEESCSPMIGRELGGGLTLKAIPRRIFAGAKIGPWRTRMMYGIDIISYY
jgi:hypothetical protein